MKAGFEKIQVLSSRIPPIRAAAVSSNLYQSHAYLWLDYRPASWNPSAPAVSAQILRKASPIFVLLL